MNSPFESGHFALTCITRTGKKQTAGNLRFIDLDDSLHLGSWVLAIMPGLVVAAGVANPKSILHHGAYIRVRVGEDPDDQYDLVYYGLTQRFVRTGQHVQIGERIAYVSNGELDIECLRNERRIEAPIMLGIEPKEQEWCMSLPAGAKYGYV